MTAALTELGFFDYVRENYKEFERRDILDHYAQSGEFPQSFIDHIAEADKPTYEELQDLYNAQCEATDNWAKKYRDLKAEKGDPRIKDLENQLRRANETITHLNLQISVKENPYDL